MTLLEGSTNRCKQCQKITTVALKDEGYCCAECGTVIIINPQDFFEALANITSNIVEPVATTFPLELEPQWCKCCQTNRQFVWYDYYMCTECGTFLGDEGKDKHG